MSVPSLLSRENVLNVVSKYGNIDPDRLTYSTRLAGNTQTVIMPKYWSLNNSMNCSMYMKVIEK